MIKLLIISAFFMGCKVNNSTSTTKALVNKDTGITAGFLVRSLNGKKEYILTLCNDKSALIKQQGLYSSCTSEFGSCPIDQNFDNCTYHGVPLNDSEFLLLSEKVKIYQQNFIQKYFIAKIGNNQSSNVGNALTDNQLQYTKLEQQEMIDRLLSLSSADNTVNVFLFDVLIQKIVQTENEIKHPERAEKEDGWFRFMMNKTSLGLFAGLSVYCHGYTGQVINCAKFSNQMVTFMGVKADDFGYFVFESDFISFMATEKWEKAVNRLHQELVINKKPNRVDLYDWLISQADSRRFSHGEALLYMASTLQNNNTNPEGFVKHISVDYFQNNVLVNSMKQINQINQLYERVEENPKPLLESEIAKGIMNEKIYHFYVPSYLSYKLHEANPKSKLAPKIPFLFNTIYEYVGGCFNLWATHGEFLSKLAKEKAPPSPNPLTNVVQPASCQTDPDTCLPNIESCHSSLEDIYAVYRAYFFAISRVDYLSKEKFIQEFAKDPKGFMTRFLSEK